ncbi:MAG: S-layer homology domain-containing protein, partial [bacterium]|nr:S-layer homology domain-containing protein [bacterium]
MKSKFRSIISLLLVMALMQSYFVFGSQASTAWDGSASSWAVPEITEAEKNGLTYDGIMNNFTRPITREEFCVIVVKLYEGISDKKAESGQNPFNDTDNPEIIKAYLLGIVKGTGAGRFSPQNKITRQELCVMIQQALEVSLPALVTDDTELTGYKDTAKIAAWAETAVRFCIHNQIIKGIGSGLIDPLGNTTREQAIAIINRTFERYNLPDFSAMPTLDLSSSPGPSLSESAKFSKLDFNNRIILPKYDTRLTLYAATGKGRPSVVPGTKVTTASISLIPIKPDITLIDPEPIQKYILRTDLRYSQTPFQFIDSTIDAKRYFAFNIAKANAAKVIWQVSKAPFNGYSPNWKKPSGLVGSGEVAASAKEFVIDFSKLAPLVTPPASQWQLISGQLVFKTTSTYRELPRAQRTYYVRAVPVDGMGNCIGDPGPGLPVIYGKPGIDSHLAAVLKPSFELWYTDRGGNPSSGGEFPNLYKHDPGRILGVSPSSSGYCFQPQQFDPKAATLTLQVSTIPFKNEPDKWSNPSGLVYKKEYDIKNLPT